MSKMAAHRFFGISRSTLDDWLQLRQETGQVSAVMYRRGYSPRLNDPQALIAFVQAKPDCTLAEMALAWHQSGGPRLSTQTFARALRRLGYTRKKSLCFLSSAAHSHAAPGSKTSKASGLTTVFIWTRPEPTTL